MRDRSKLIYLGGEIRRLRKARDLTQADLAERVGVAENFIGMIERGERGASVLLLFEIAAALDIYPGALFKAFEPST